MPLIYWPHAFQTAVYLINRMPTPTLDNRSPYSILFGTSPKYAYLRDFGSLFYPWIRPYTFHKLEPRLIACVFIGYSPTQHAYLCLDPKTNRVYSSRHVRFVDSVYPFQSILCQTNSPDVSTPAAWCSVSLPLLSNSFPDNTSITLAATKTSFNSHSDSPSPSHSSSTTASHTPSSSPANNSTTPASTSPLPSPPPPRHPHITRASRNIFKPINKLNLSAQLSPTEPTTVKQALSDP